MNPPVHGRWESGGTSGGGSRRLPAAGQVPTPCSGGRLGVWARCHVQWLSWQPVVAQHLLVCAVRQAGCEHLHPQGVRRRGALPARRCPRCRHARQGSARREELVKMVVVVVVMVVWQRIGWVHGGRLRMLQMLLQQRMLLLLLLRW